MVVALALIGLLYLLGLAALAGIVVVGATDSDPRGWLTAVAVLVGAPALFVAHLRGAPQLVLRATRAQVLAPGEQPELQALVARLAAVADLPPPRVAIVRSRAINAFAVGIRPTTAVVAVTTEALRRLEPRELEAVVAHELAHVANRDGLVLTVVSVPAVIGSRLLDGDDYRAWIAFVAYAPIFAVGLLLMWTIARYREYVADRGAVLITGAPEQLMSALQLAERRRARGDLRGGAAVSAFCIVSTRKRRFELISDHPPLEKRLRRLAALSRSLGHPA